MKARTERGLLSGLTVLELSHALAGPATSQVLADYGARVIKVERPGTGDIFRDTPGMGPAMFLAVNRGKESVAIDLKNPKGLEVFYRLAKVSDVIVENLAPGAAEKLGVFASRARRGNPGLVYCKVESFGEGPYSSIPAFDPVLQAATGIMSTTGFAPDKFVRAGVSIVDLSTGLHAANGILALLFRRYRTTRGGLLRVSLYDAAAYFMSYWISMFDLYGKDTKPLGTTHIFGAPYNLFRVKDAKVYVAVANDGAWESFCKALGFEDLLASRKYKTSTDRVKNKTELEKIVARRMSRISFNQIEKSLQNRGVPFAKLNTARSLVLDPHFLGRDILKKYEYARKKFRTVVNPSVVDGWRPYAARSPPSLGEDTDSVLKSVLHLSEREIRELRSEHVIH
jgi:crotonobetainyl-CoA:carnitine CoA-transferase CaiB-like acyl-CoA transferase